MVEARAGAMASQGRPPRSLIDAVRDLAPSLDVVAHICVARPSSVVPELIRAGLWDREAFEAQVLGSMAAPVGGVVDDASTSVEGSVAELAMAWGAGGAGWLSTAGSRGSETSVDVDWDTDLGSMAAWGDLGAPMAGEGRDAVGSGSVADIVPPHGPMSAAMREQVLRDLDAVAGWGCAGPSGRDRRAMEVDGPAKRLLDAFTDVWLQRGGESDAWLPRNPRIELVRGAALAVPTACVLGSAHACSLYVVLLRSCHDT